MPVTKVGDRLNRGSSAVAKGRFDDSLDQAIRLSGFVANARRYVSDPGSAPEGVDVKEGEHGGHYYETGPETAGPKNERPAVRAEREKRARQDSAGNKQRGEEEYRRKNMPELDEALDDLKGLMLNIRDGGGLANPQELVDAARNVARAVERQNGLAGSDPKRSELASQVDADRSALQHALELHQNWKNRSDYAQAKRVPGEEEQAVQERLESAKNEVLQARDKYKRSRAALDQYTAGKKQKPGAADAETEKWQQIEQQQDQKLRDMAARGATMADMQKQSEVLTQVRNRLRSMDRQRQRAAKPAAKPSRKVNNHRDSEGSTAHHKNMYRDEYQDHALANPDPAPHPTAEQADAQRKRDEYRRQMDFAELDLHEDANGSTEHHHGIKRVLGMKTPRQKDREAALEAAAASRHREQFHQMTGRRINMHEDSNGSTEHHHAGGGSRERPTDPRERAMQGADDALEDAEGMSSDEIKQLARRSGMLGLNWGKMHMNERQAKTYMRKYQQGLLHAHDKALEREQQGGASSADRPARQPRTQFRHG